MKIGDAREFWKAYQTGQGSADHTDFQVFEEVIQPLIDYARSESSEVSILTGLLNAARCPNCDGSGAYMVNMSSTDAELQQCEWCARKNAAVSEEQGPCENTWHTEQAHVVHRCPDCDSEGRAPDA